MTTPPATGNRRQYDRCYLRGVATVVLSPKDSFEVRTLDISSGGMAIVAAANPRPGTTFSIKVSLPLRPKGFTAIEARVQVMHSILASDEQGFKVGLQFVNLDTATAAAIVQFLTRP
ncbi:MAG: PilZ domain-containing protein [Burkholderiaceae bacterium]|nr:PilZ domain-containing protein [Burkholderiaceae bacterium]